MTLLPNPVFAALTSGDSHQSRGSDDVKYFDEAVSPFIGFRDGYDRAFDDLFDTMPDGRMILHATPEHIRTPRGWRLLVKARGLQLGLAQPYTPQPTSATPVPLQPEHVDEMIALATLTRPGPFAARTIEFGQYHGIFEEGKLVAMTGQRLHVGNHTEISAVCTHPDFLGKGYAFALVQHQIGIIEREGKTPFLHVREDNERAIALYQRMGFSICGPMNFYFLKRRTRQAGKKNHDAL